MGMTRSDIISNVLIKYTAFLYRTAGKNSNGYTTTGYNYMSDTEFPGWACLTLDDELVDYSSILTFNLTAENIDAFEKDIMNAITIKKIPISKLNANTADEIMVKNMESMQRLPKIYKKFEYLKDVIKKGNEFFV